MIYSLNLEAESANMCCKEVGQLGFSGPLVCFAEVRNRKRNIVDCHRKYGWVQYVDWPEMRIMDHESAMGCWVHHDSFLKSGYKRDNLAGPDIFC